MHSRGAYISLVGAEEVAEEGVLHPQRQHLPLNHCALNVVILQHHVFSARVSPSTFFWVCSKIYTFFCKGYLKRFQILPLVKCTYRIYTSLYAI